MCGSGGDRYGMARLGQQQQPAESVSPPPRCPDLLQHVECSLPPPRSPLYCSFFEEECRAIVSRLLRGVAASPRPGRDSTMWLGAAGPLTSTPMQDASPLDQGLPDSVGCEATPCPAAPRRLPPPGSSPRPQALPRKAARRGAGLGPASRPRTPVRSPGRARLARGAARPAIGAELAGAAGTEPSQPRGTKLKVMPGAKSRLQHPSGTSQLTRPSAIPKPAAQNAQMETNSAAAAKVGGRKQPSQRLSTAIPTVASRARLRLLGKVPSPKRVCSGSTTQELICNTTRELKENCESKEWLVVAGTVLEAGKTDQTWVCGGSSFSSKLAPRIAVPAEQSAGDQLSQELKCLKDELKYVKDKLEHAKNEWERVTNKMEHLTNEMEHAKNEWESTKDELKHVKNELEQVKSELADKTAQCKAYCQTILQAQLGAAGICQEDGAVEKSGDSQQPLVQMLLGQ